MLSTAHFQLGLNAVAENRLDDAISHFEAVLAIKPGDKDAQDQLDLIDLYTAALNYWERDWSATIQALKGLYALAPDYKDVRCACTTHMSSAEMNFRGWELVPGWRRLCFCCRDPAPGDDSG